MKRYPFVIGATVAGLAGVLSYHTQGTPHAFSSGASASAGSKPGGGSGSSAPSRTSTATAPPATASPAATPSTTPSTPVPPQASATSSATGRLEQYGYGQLSVRVTMSGGHITKAAVATLQTADTYSQQLAAQAIPILEREVLSAQSARIHALTGATYTSEAYAYSVQSALDKLHK